MKTQINYDGIVKAILSGKLKQYIDKNKISTGLLSLLLECSESYIKEMINGDIPKSQWLSDVGWDMFCAVRKIDKKIIIEKKRLQEVIIKNNHTVTFKINIDKLYDKGYTEDDINDIFNILFELISREINKLINEFPKADTLFSNKKTENNVKTFNGWLDDLK